MKKHFILLMMAIPVLGLSSCMSIFFKYTATYHHYGRKWNKTLRRCKQCKISRNQRRRIYYLQTKKKLSDRTVIAKKEGYKNTPFVIESAFNAKALWNILFWPGFLIDLGTGKINKYDPVIYNIEMEKE